MSIRQDISCFSASLFWAFITFQMFEICFFCYFTWLNFPYFLSILLDGPIAAKLSSPEAIINRLPGP